MVEIYYVESLYREARSTRTLKGVSTGAINNNLSLSMNVSR